MYYKMEVEIRAPKRATREEIINVIQELDEKYCLNLETSHLIKDGKKMTLNDFLNLSNADK